jgi:hypothetical protein
MRATCGPRRASPAARRGRAAILAFSAAAALRAQPALDADTAERFAKLALACVGREYPNKPEHVLTSAADLQSPQALHPAFFGCYDWHSSVHGHWMLTRLLRLQPQLASSADIRRVLDAHLTAEAAAADARYLQAEANRAFERPYGWAWLLQLSAELARSDDPSAKEWRARLAPAESAVVARLREYLPKLTRPVRSGIHPNTAFALGLAYDYAQAVGDRELERVIAARAHFYYGADRACPVSYEPSGEDFFSPCLAEADLMRRVMTPREYGTWLRQFLPALSTRHSAGLTPAVVSDPTDPRLVHLDGLNLSRAWMLRGMAAGLPPKDHRRAALHAAADAHAAAGLARVTSGHYEGEHWLASFAVYLLTQETK